MAAPIRNPMTSSGLPTLSATAKALVQIATKPDHPPYLTDGRFLAANPWGDYARQHTPSRAGLTSNSQEIET